MTSHRELLDTAVAAARQGAEVLLRTFRDADLEVRHKEGHDLVSRADHESEARIVGEIRRRFPDHHVLAEERGFESGGEAGDGDRHEWLIDPLDGTTNFLHGLPVFCISVACRRGGRLLAGVVLDPVGRNLFTAARGEGASWNGRPLRISRTAGLPAAFLATGYPFRARAALDLYLDVFRDVFHQARAIRRCGAAALDLAYTAAGVYDGFFEFRLSPWDIAAGILLVQEAGGVVSDLDGGDAYFAGGNVLAGAPAVHRDLLAVVRRHAGEATLDGVEPSRNTIHPAPVG